MVSPSQTLFVLTRKHEPFFSAELADVPSNQMIVQPSNRGTLAAVMCSLARIAQVDPHAEVAFFPSDHYFSREKAFVQGVLAAFENAVTDPDQVVLLGSKAMIPETGYGYIEPAEETAGACGRLKRVGRFWEKPTAPVAQSLMDRGCLWNTFVMVGRVQAFLDLIESSAPEMYREFLPVFSAGNHFSCQSRDLEEIFDRLPSADFSRLVLSNGVDRTAGAGPRRYRLERSWRSPTSDRNTFGAWNSQPLAQALA